MRTEEWWAKVSTNNNNLKWSSEVLPLMNDGLEINNKKTNFTA